MSSRWPRVLLSLIIPLALGREILHPQARAKSSSSSSSAASSQLKKPAPASNSTIDPGTVSNGIYRNKTLGFTCKIPAGWVLRTDEMNAEDESRDQPVNSANRDNQAQPPTPGKDAKDASEPSEGTRGRVLLAAFSRPPEAHGEEVNASIVIAAEPVTAYPGLKEAAQYFEPLTEVALVQGFTVDEEPYEIAIGTKTLVRGDFHKDIGTRVMRQSTLAMLVRGYAVSFTVIGGTEDEVEDLIDGLDFVAARPPAK